MVLHCTGTDNAVVAQLERDLAARLQGALEATLWPVPDYGDQGDYRQAWGRFTHAQARYK
jgi:hypothetical protein